MRNLLILILIISCSTPNVTKDYHSIFKKNIEAGRCEAAAKTIPLEKDSTKAVTLVKDTFGKVVAFAAIGVTVSFDMLFLGGCSEFGCHKDSPFPFSRPTNENTKKLRCPRTHYYVRKLLTVSDCYKNSSDKISKEKRSDLLIELDSRAESFFSCINKDDRYQIKLRLGKECELSENKERCLEAKVKSSVLLFENNTDLNCKKLMKATFKTIKKDREAFLDLRRKVLKKKGNAVVINHREKIAHENVFETTIYRCGGRS